MLRELQQYTGVEVRVLACQTGPLPAEICPGLSEPVQRAVPEAAAWVVREYFDAAVQNQPWG
jgi:Ni,Fe-hydrogenase maturation factor